MISGSNNNYQVSNNRPVTTSNTVVQSQAQTTQTTQVAQNNQTNVQASSVSFLGPISDFLSQVWSSIKNFIGGIFHLSGSSAASTGVAAQSVSSGSQPVATTPTTTTSSNAAAVTPEAPVLVSSNASAAPLKISLPTSSSQTTQTTQSNVTTTVQNGVSLLGQISKPQPQTVNTQTSSQVVSAQTTIQPLEITPSLKKAAAEALPEVDRLLSQFAALKPALDLFHVKKPSADEILSYLMEAKIAINQISQGQQPSVHGSGLADFGKKTFKFSNDALRIVMTAKGLAQLFNYKDASFTKGVSEAEKSLMDIRVFSDILARSVE